MARGLAATSTASGGPAEGPPQAAGGIGPAPSEKGGDTQKAEAPECLMAALGAHSGWPARALNARGVAWCNCDCRGGRPLAGSSGHHRARRMPRRAPASAGSPSGRRQGWPDSEPEAGRRPLGLAAQAGPPGRVCPSMAAGGFLRLRRPQRAKWPMGESGASVHPPAGQLEAQQSATGDGQNSGPLEFSCCRCHRRSVSTAAGSESAELREPRSQLCMIARHCPQLAERRQRQLQTNPTGTEPLWWPPALPAYAKIRRLRPLVAKPHPSCVHRQ